jgi:hypothetical protein
MIAIDRLLSALVERIAIPWEMLYQLSYAAAVDRVESPARGNVGGT